GLIATLWPAGIRSTVVTPSATTSPGGRLERAISTPSSGWSRMTGAGVMRASFDWANGSGEQPVRIVPFSIPYSVIRRLRLHLCLAGGILSRLRHLHARVGRHQPTFIREGHKPEAHVDGANRAFGAAAVNTGIETAFAAFLHDLLVDLQNL